MAALLKIECLGMTFQNPVLVASGTFGYGDEYWEVMPFSELGGIVTKTISRAPRAGNPPPRIAETDSGMLNSIGLANVGLDVFIESKLPWIIEHRGESKVIVNFAGFSEEEYIEVGHRLGKYPQIDALEVNLGCPNVNAGYIHFGACPETVGRVIRGIRENCGIPLFAKLTPNVTDIAALAQAAVEAGASGISLINTMPGMAIDVRRRSPKLALGFGGLSGPAIRPIGVACVYKVYQRLREMGRPDVPIMGIGGIASGEDALEYILAGAALVQVGTANFLHPQMPRKVVNGIRAYCEEHGVEDIRDLVGDANVR